jgi:hypothetical protein
MLHLILLNPTTDKGFTVGDLLPTVFGGEVPIKSITWNHSNSKRELRIPSASHSGIKISAKGPTFLAAINSRSTKSPS